MVSWQQCSRDSPKWRRRRIPSRGLAFGVLLNIHGASQRNCLPRVRILALRFRSGRRPQYRTAKEDNYGLPYVRIEKVERPKSTSPNCDDSDEAGFRICSIHRHDMLGVSPSMCFHPRAGSNERRFQTSCLGRIDETSAILRSSLDARQTKWDDVSNCCCDRKTTIRKITA